MFSNKFWSISIWIIWIKLKLKFSSFVNAYLEYSWSLKKFWRLKIWTKKRAQIQNMGINGLSTPPGCNYLFVFSSANAHQSLRQFLMRFFYLLFLSLTFTFLFTLSLSLSIYTSFDSPNTIPSPATTFISFILRWKCLFISPLLYLYSRLMCWYIFWNNITWMASLDNTIAVYLSKQMLYFFLKQNGRKK